MYKEKYCNPNIISKKLLKNFFGGIARITSPIRNDLNHILEVGCGHGYSTFELSRIFNKSIIESSDIDSGLAQDARIKNPNIIVTTESIYDLDRDDDSFDMIIVLEVLEHLEFPEKALTELSRVSKKYCLISVPNEPLWRILNMARGSYWYDFGNTPGHVNHWSTAGIFQLVNRYFTVINVFNVIPWTILLARK